MNFRRKLAIFAVPAVLAIGGGAIAVHASSPNPAPPKAAADGTDPAEATGAEIPATAETPEAPEAPGTAAVGHADPAGDVNYESTANQ